MSKALTYCLLILAATGIAFTLEEAVEVALSSRGDVQAARGSLQSASWESRGADLWFLPSVSGQLSYVYNHDIQTMEVPGMGSFETGTEWNSRYGLTAMLPLYVPQGPAGSKLASLTEELSELRLEATEQDAVMRVVEAFYGVMLAEMMVEVSLEALETAGEGYDLAVMRFETGTISRFELLQSRVAFENRRPDAIAAESALESAIAGLSVALGIGCDELVIIEGALSDPLPFTFPSSLEEAREIMTEENPDLRIAERMEGMGEAQVDMARSSFLPSVVARTDYTYLAGVNDLGNLNAADYHRSWSTSIALEVPLFNGLTDVSGYNSARASRLAAQGEARSLSQVTELMLVQAWNGFHEAGERLAATEATLSQAEEAAGIATVSYEAGMITRLEMDQSFLALTQSRTNHASALYSVRTSEARLARAMGVLRIGGEK